jgi:hypothetical protein
MTKTVRVENADLSDYKVKVLVQELKYDYENKCMGTEWITVKTISLDYPTHMAQEYITNTKRLVIEENGVRE